MSEWKDDEEYRLSEQDWNVYTKNEFLSNAVKWEQKTEKEAKKLWKRCEIYNYKEYKLCPCNLRRFDNQIQCDKCSRWFHLKCINMREHEIPEDDFICLKCKREKRKAKRSIPFPEKFRSKNIGKKSKSPKSFSEHRRRIRRITAELLQCDV